MALNVPSYAGDPTSSSPVVNAYVQVIGFNENKITQQITVAVGYYHSSADFAAGLAPVNTATYTVTANPEKRSDGTEIPSIATVIAEAVTLNTDAAGSSIYSLVDRSILQFLLAVFPEFAGATIVA